MSTAKRSFTLPRLSAPIKRRHLRKYSWLPDVLRIKDSVIGRIFGPVLTVTLFATLICYLKHIGHHVVLTNSVVPLLSVVVGLILVFRNGTSYDRYWEGRKSWSTLTSNVRNFSRKIWLNAVLPPPDKEKPGSAKMTSLQLRRIKEDTLRLAAAFPFALKHYLREEEGMNWPDLQGVLPIYFKRYVDTGAVNSQHTTPNPSYDATATSTQQPTRSNSWAPSESGYTSDAASRGNATKRVRAKRSKHHLPANPLSGATTPLLSDSYSTVDFSGLDMSMPLPLLIAHELGRIVFFLRREGLLEVVGPAGTNAIAALIASMVDQMSGMERVANTPIPKSYSIHLKQCVTLYLFALPLTLVSDLGWATIPIVTVVAFTFMGIEGIADEIEMPFGDDAGDLPLDRYCHDLLEEMHFIIAQLPDGGLGTLEYDDGEGDD